MGKAKKQERNRRAKIDKRKANDLKNKVLAMDDDKSYALMDNGKYLPFGTEVFWKGDMWKTFYGLTNKRNDNQTAY